MPGDITYYVLIKWFSHRSPMGTGSHIFHNFIERQVSKGMQNPLSFETSDGLMPLQILAADSLEVLKTYTTDTPLNSAA